MLSLKNKKILITGGTGFLGRRLREFLISEKNVGEENILTVSSRDFDLRKIEDCEKAVRGRDVIFHLAGKVPSRIEQQRIPGVVFFDNVMINARLLEAARLEKVEKTVLIGSSLAYPENIKVPFKETDLWNGYPPRNAAPYALSKRILAVQSIAYAKQYGMNVICLILPNFYGPGDKFNFDSLPLIPSLITKISEAKRKGDKFIDEYGGNDRIELMFIDDVVQAVVLAAEIYDKPEHINIGSGVLPPSIKEIAEIIESDIGYDGEIKWAVGSNHGSIRYLDISQQEKILGWHPVKSLKEGINSTVKWYLANKKNI